MFLFCSLAVNSGQAILLSNDNNLCLKALIHSYESFTVTDYQGEQLLNCDWQCYMWLWAFWNSFKSTFLSGHLSSSKAIDLIAFLTDADCFDNTDW